MNEYQNQKLELYFIKNAIKNEIMSFNECIQYLKYHTYFYKLKRLNNLFENKIHDFFHLVRISNLDFVLRKNINNKIMILEHLPKLKIHNFINDEEEPRSVFESFFNYYKNDKYLINYEKYFNKCKNIDLSSFVEILNLYVLMLLNAFIFQNKVEKVQAKLILMIRNNCAHNVPVIIFFKKDFNNMSKALELIHEIANCSVENKIKNEILINDKYLNEYLNANFHWLKGYGLINKILIFIKNCFNSIAQN